jgi:hypothetical protein
MESCTRHKVSATHKVWTEEFRSSLFAEGAVLALKGDSEFLT